ncbi:sodium-dependent transporter [Marinobacter koreensis]|uniref:Sodium-dependent transporter n=1 Tax=Marinobacter koreensis TaxID=335974 RepID=A0ABW0RN46_9GAMM|nr:sodium-dependent transporter [Marinobacter koreensis]MCK7547418.1 sodium-dependent transporter [Marinobacter koreensis]
MSTPYQTAIGSFTRKSTFFWASVGATVGLANLWQFPYLASRHGGGLFILIYLACLLLITLPLMVTEASLGRYSRHGIVLALDGLIRGARASRLWMFAGRLSILAAFLVLSYTLVFGAIALAYVFFGAMGEFSSASMGDAGGVLSGLVSDPDHYRRFVAWYTFFVILVVWVSMQGVVSGIERTMRVVVPGTLLLLAGLFVLSLWQGHMNDAVDQILGWHPADVTAGSVKAALFQAFFTLGLGMGVWTVFGAYTTSHTALKRSLLAVVLMDTLVAIVAGLMVYSLSAAGAEADSARGFGLLFISLPVNLAALPGSQVLIAVAFLMVVLVVWTTSVALMEPVIGWFREWTGAPRGVSSLLVGLMVWLAGLVSLLSFNLWAEIRFAGATVFRWLELFSGGLLIPLVASLVALFTGWCLTRRLALSLIGRAPRPVASIWYWVMRLVLPVVVAYIGISYILFSLSSLCQGSTGRLWCGQAEPVVSETHSPAVEKKADDVPDNPAPEEAPPVPVTSPPSEGSGDPGTAPAKRSPHENAPKQDDILYHSV